MGNQRQLSGQPALFDGGRPMWWEVPSASRREVVLTLARLLLECTDAPAQADEQEAADHERED